MKKPLEQLTYCVLVTVSLAALGLFFLLPRLSLLTNAVYQGF